MSRPSFCPTATWHMTTNLSSRTLIILHILLGTWNRYPFCVHYCDVCDALYDWWLGCDGCGQPPAGATESDAAVLP
jgi:hypothetical protein